MIKSFQTFAALKIALTSSPSDTIKCLCHCNGFTRTILRERYPRSSDAWLKTGQVKISNKMYRLSPDNERQKWCKGHFITCLCRINHSFFKNRRTYTNSKTKSCKAFLGIKQNCFKKTFCKILDIIYKGGRQNLTAIQQKPDLELTTVSTARCDALCQADELNILIDIQVKKIHQVTR